MKRRVVVTGMGIWSCIGHDLASVTNSLRCGQSGIVFDIDRINNGLQSGLAGKVGRPDIKKMLNRDERILMTIDAEYAYMAVKQALKQARITQEYIEQNEIGIIFGDDGHSANIEELYACQIDHNKIAKIDPFAWVTHETSNCNIALTTLLHLRGINFCVGGACASGSHAIGIGYTYIQQGLQDMILVGGTCEINATSSAAADALGALSMRNNDPQHASRPFDKDRDGMVSSGGAAALVLEEYEHAKARGATILAEVVGYGFSSNGIEEISIPSAEGEYVAMKRALDDAGLEPSDIDYVNAHATSTIAGDIEEAKALTRLFVKENQIINHKSEIINRKPYVSSTKSMTGHENWMAGASEAVYSILMMQNNFVAPNINLENVIDEAKDLNIVRETIYTPIRTVLSNSSGMGGTNSALVFRKI